MAAKKLIQTLNKLRDEEVSASLQYMNHHAVFKNKNMDGIAEFLEKAAIDEMKHAEWLTDRLLNMGENPGGYKIGVTPHWGIDLKESLKKDVDLEISAIALYNDAIDLCSKERDHLSRQLLDTIIKDEEEHRLGFEKLHDALELIGSDKAAIGLIQVLKSGK